jgi:hypothetical protein
MMEKWKETTILLNYLKFITSIIQLKDFLIIITVLKKINKI